MPAFDDHPVTLLLRRYGLTQSELARRAGVSRSTVDQLVQGRAKNVNPKIAAALGAVSNIPTRNIEVAVQRWREAPRNLPLKDRHRMVLSVDPEDLPRIFPTFAAWRSEFAPNPTMFASVIRENVLTVTKYERGMFVSGMPSSLHNAIVRTFGVSDAYVVGLGRLPVGR